MTDERIRINSDAVSRTHLNIYDSDVWDEYPELRHRALLVFTEGQKQKKQNMTLRRRLARWAAFLWSRLP